MIVEQIPFNRVVPSFPEAPDCRHVRKINLLANKAMKTAIVPYVSF
jgi:hypothetical protein